MIVRLSWVWIGFLVALGAIVLSRQLPDLIDDEKSAFAYVAGFISLYGLALAIVEAYKAKSAAEQALEESKAVSAKLSSMYSLRDAAECQTCIENAMRIADQKGPIPLAILARISKLYASEFSGAAITEGSVEHGHLLMIESYGALAPTQRARSVKIKSTLLGMGTQLAIRGSEHIASESA